MALSPQGVTRDSSPEAAAAEAVLQSAVGKAALRFVPLLTIAYLFNYLDRTSVGIAALTMNQWAIGEPVRTGRRDPVPVLFGVRDTEQPPALSVRCPALARLHHDQLGDCVGGERLCDRTEQLLCRAVSARRRRGRLLPGRDVLPRRLVSGAIPHPDAGLVPDRDSRIRSDRWPGLRHAAADGRHLGTGGMAMAVHPVSRP
jgi:hypothetical protein